MRELAIEESNNVNGGMSPLAVLAAVYLIGNLIDVGYNAVNAFKEGYQSNDHT